MLAGSYTGAVVEVVCAKSQPGMVLARADGGLPVAVLFKSGIGTARILCPWGRPERVELHWLDLPAELVKGPRASPPKGYPKDRSQYAVPESYQFPIDRKHIHAAIDYFSKHPWKGSDHKRRAAKRILSAAKRYGVHISPDSDVARAAKGGVNPDLTGEGVH